MKTNWLVFGILLALLVTSCTNKNAPVTSKKDFEGFISLFVSDKGTETEMKFWTDRLNRMPGDEASLTKLAGLYSDRFKLTGNVRDIELSDSIYLQVLSSSPQGSPELYQSLAANAITQHRFRDAREYVEKAIALKDKQAGSLLILVDVSLELGDIPTAKRVLNEFRNKNSFAYLIRKAKMQDHEGHLDSAIMLMEKAYQRVQGNRSASLWTISNLGDMYGHAGRIEEAYQSYLTVLNEDPSDAYALKGIAWIAYSNDHNTTDAKMIMTSLASRKRMPEAYMILAEIAEFEGDTIEQKSNLKKFVELASHPNYKTMYHKYLATVAADEYHRPDLCLQIAEQEIKNRPTPQSYDLAAWAYYKQNNLSKAYNISKTYVEEMTFEPEVLYHTGMIHLAIGKKESAEKYLSDALNSEFELGPNISARIRSTLKSLEEKSTFSNQ